VKASIYVGRISPAAPAQHAYIYIYMRIQETTQCMRICPLRAAGASKLKLKALKCMISIMTRSLLGYRCQVLKCSSVGGPPYETAVTSNRQRRDIQLNMQIPVAGRYNQTAGNRPSQDHLTDNHIRNTGGTVLLYLRWRHSQHHREKNQNPGQAAIDVNTPLSCACSNSTCAWRQLILTLQPAGG